MWKGTISTMEVNFSPELERRLNDLAMRSGRPAAELVRDAVADLVDELADTRNMLDRRYDDIKSDKVKLIPGDEIEAYFREKSENARRS
jgi:predicted DNA-binding protein